jgi:hypothetical protein
MAAANEKAGQEVRAAPARAAGGGHRGRLAAAAALSAVLGLASLLSTQYLARDALGPVLEACAGGGGRPPRAPDEGEDGAGSGAAGGFLDALRDIATRPRHQAELASRGYRPYVPLLGGTAACIRTQLLYKVVAADDADADAASSSSPPPSSPSAQQLLGWMALLVNASAVLPLVALVLVESDKARRGRRRQHAGGGFGSASWLAGSATLVLLASHLWGASFAVPFLWLPARLVSAAGDDDGEAGAGSVPAAKGARGAATVAGLALAASGPALLLWVPPLASGWGWVAAGLGGPAAALVPLAAGGLLRSAASLFARAAGPRPPGGAPPPGPAPSSPSGGGGGAVRAYGAAGTLSLCLWTAAVFLAFAGYGVDYRGLAADAAGTGGGDGDPRGPLVRYLLADAAGAYAAALLFLAYRSVPACLEAALLHAFVFGPGAAVSMMLAQLEGQQQVREQRGAVCAPSRAAAASPAKKKES